MNETLFKFYHNSYFVLFVQSALNLNNSINLEGDIVVLKIILVLCQIIEIIKELVLLFIMQIHIKNIMKKIF